MTVITIPKKLTKRGDLVIIPRKDYEFLLGAIKRKKISSRSRLDLELAEAIQEVKKGKVFGPFTSVKELKKSLER